MLDSAETKVVPSAGYVIAGTAIWATGVTPEDAYADYVRSTGDDSVALDDLPACAGTGRTFIAPASQALLDLVGKVGGDIAWGQDRRGTQCLESELAEVA